MLYEGRRRRPEPEAQCYTRAAMVAPGRTRSNLGSLVTFEPERLPAHELVTRHCGAPVLFDVVNNNPVPHKVSIWVPVKRIRQISA